VTSKVKLLLLHLTSHRLTLALTATQMQKMQLHLMHQPTDGIIYDTLILTYILHYITLHQCCPQGRAPVPVRCLRKKTSQATATLTDTSKPHANWPEVANLKKLGRDVQQVKQIAVVTAAAIVAF